MGRAGFHLGSNKGTPPPPAILRLEEEGDRAPTALGGLLIADLGTSRVSRGQMAQKKFM